MDGTLPLGGRDAATGLGIRCCFEPAYRVASAPPRVPAQVAWHSLQSTLAEALPEGVLHTGHSFLGFTEGPDGVAAEFETAGGVRRLEAGVLLGADGGQSAVRQALLGDGPPQFLGEGGRSGRGVGRALPLPACLALDWLLPCIATPRGAGSSGVHGPAGEGWYQAGIPTHARPQREAAGPSPRQAWPSGARCARARRAGQTTTPFGAAWAGG